jgi:hypothetical protein
MLTRVGGVTRSCAIAPESELIISEELLRNVAPLVARIYRSTSPFHEKMIRCKRRRKDAGVYFSPLSHSTR